MPESDRFFSTIGCAFHYAFNYEHANRPMPYPKKVIDTLIDMYNNKDNGSFGDFKLFTRIQFYEMDFVYMLTRSVAQTGYRFDEVTELLKDFADNYIGLFESLDPDTDEWLNDIHMLFGGVCCLAELQQFLRGYIVSTKPLKLVLDRRPFI